MLFRSLLTIGLVVFLCAPLGAQDATVQVSNGFGATEGVAEVAVTLKPDVRATGWALGFCHDDDLVVSDVFDGVDIEDLDFELHLVSRQDDGWTAIATLAADDLLPARESELYVAEYELGDIGVYRAYPCDDFDDLIIYYEDDTQPGEGEITPETLAGEIEARPIFVRGGEHTVPARRRQRQRRGAGDPRRALHLRVHLRQRQSPAAVQGRRRRRRQR